MNAAMIDNVRADNGGGSSCGNVCVRKRERVYWYFFPFFLIVPFRVKITDQPAKRKEKHKNYQLLLLYVLEE